MDENNETEFTLVSPELIEYAARVGHETLAKYRFRRFTEAVPDWPDASLLARGTAMMLIPHIAAGADSKRVHELWVDSLLAVGWCYAEGPANAVEKTSPLLIPWDRLPPARRRSVEVFRAAVRGALDMG